MNPLNTGLVLLACAAVVALLGVLAQIKRRQNARRNAALKQFYRNAELLVQAPETPTGLVGMLTLFNEWAGKRWTPLYFICLLFVRQSEDEDEAVPRRQIEHLPAPLRRAVLEAVDGFFSSLLWQSLFLGWAFRMALRIAPASAKRDSDGGQIATELRLAERACTKAA